MIKNFCKILIIMLIMASCSKKEVEKLDVNQNALFFNIVYNTKYYRIKDSASWRLIQGKQTLQFLRSAATNEEAVDLNAGTFILTFENYKELGLSNTNACSGGYQGNFTSTAITGTSSSGDTTANPIYDPNVPYNPNEVTDAESTINIDPVTGEEIPAATYNFEFILDVVSKSLTAGCSAVNPLSQVKFDILRFTSNGDLIVTDYNRGLEYYMIPIVK